MEKMSDERVIELLMAKKSRHILVNIEPLLYEAFSLLVQRECESSDIKLSLSARVRALIIKELLEKQVIPQGIID